MICKYLSKILSVSILVSVIAGCALPVRQMSQKELESGFADYTASYQEELEAAASKSRARLYYEYDKTADATYDILVLSGGGPLGAFGAGFLQGWGQVEMAEFKRPVFDSVSGVSTGALIAPFAFVGTDEAYQDIVTLYSNPDEDLIVPRTILAFLAGNGAYYDTSRLHERIGISITPDMVEHIAQGSRDNRVLLVGATNLDYGLMRVWDLAAIADALSFDASHTSTTQKLIASSAIPSAFPPVEMDDYLYVDGGASMQIVSGIDDRQWLYGSKPLNLEFVKRDKPIKIRIWVIINNKLIMDPEVTSPTWSSIAQRSLFTLMRGSTLQTLQDIETFSQMINKLDAFDVQMQYVAIPQHFTIPNTRRMFDKEKMLKLVELGRIMGSDPGSWQNEALRPGAPFLAEDPLSPKPQ